MPPPVGLQERRRQASLASSQRTAAVRQHEPAGESNGGSGNARPGLATSGANVPKCPQQRDRNATCAVSPECPQTDLSLLKSLKRQ